MNTVSHRIRRDQKCPYCSGNKVTIENSLFNKHPKLIKEWNYVSNEDNTD